MNLHQSTSSTPKVQCLAGFILGGVHLSVIRTWTHHHGVTEYSHCPQHPLSSVIHPFLPSSPQSLPLSLSPMSVFSWMLGSTVRRFANYLPNGKSGTTMKRQAAAGPTPRHLLILCKLQTRGGAAEFRRAYTGPVLHAQLLEHWRVVGAHDLSDE